MKQGMKQGRRRDDMSQNSVSSQLPGRRDVSMDGLLLSLHSSLERSGAPRLLQTLALPPPCFVDLLFRCVTRRDLVTSLRRCAPIVTRTSAARHFRAVLALEDGPPLSYCCFTCCASPQRASPKQAPQRRDQSWCARRR